MGIRRGAEFLQSLRDGRAVWLHGERVDVTSHPNLAGCAQAIAAVYDLQHEPPYRDLLTIASPTTGEPVSLAYLLPQSPDDLDRKRQMIEFLMGRTGAVMGRLPEYVALIVLGLYDVRPLLAAANPAYAENVAAYFEYCREQDLCVSHGFVDPQRPRRATADDFEYLRVVKERPDGVVLRGAKGVATLAPYANEFLCLTVMRPDIRPEEIIYCAVPLGAEGVTVICRESLAPRYPEDHPLAGSFDEMDAWVVLEDVFVPHERIFYRHSSDALPTIHSKLLAWAFYHILIRMAVKAEALLGVAVAVTDYLGTAQVPQVQAGLADMICYVEVLKALVHEAERTAGPSVSGLVVPHPSRVLAGRVFAVEHEPHVLQVLRQVCSSGILMAPGEAELTHPELSRHVYRYLVGRDERAPDRFRLLRLAWDYAVDSFGGRQLLFDMFNARDLHANKATLAATYDTRAATGLAARLAGAREARE
jgi:4-hydroxyphenylacetate 3-monooxygenase